MWEVVLVEEVAEWFTELVTSDAKAATAVTAAIDRLEQAGPALGRPTADVLKGSKIHHLKELRPAGESIRIIFAFDPARHAVLLVAGDKAGNWKPWYTTNIPVAEKRYRDWLDGHYDEEIP